jgi:hydroxysqualene dehydroxylase
VTPPRRVHVVGAGLAGLAAARRLADAAIPVTLYEAAGHAGGRCRSYFDATLGCRIDNGNHLLLAGNRAAVDYLAGIGAADTMVGPALPDFSFLDLPSGRRWLLRPNPGRLPWWLCSRGRRVPDTRALDYVAVLAVLRARAADRVTDRVDPTTVVFRRLWQPLAVAALNTAAEEGAATLFAALLRETFGKGGAACRPLVPRVGLSESFIEPALAHLGSRGVALRFNTRLRALDWAGDRVAALSFDAESVALAADEAVILAVPPPVAARLLPGTTVPDEFRAIVNAHYRIAAAPSAPLFVGLIGGTAEWVFRKEGVLSVTVSAADRLAEQPAEALAALLWRDAARAYDLPAEPLPPWQIVKERRATFAATPAQVARRPGTRTRWRNLALAGDWTDTGLPATIEGAIRSGDAAARAIRQMEMA